MGWKRLLVPYDFSACAAQALALASDLAEALGACIVVVHVSELPENLDASVLVHPPAAAGPTRADAFAMRGARAALEELAEPLGARGLDVRAMALVGEVSTAILQAVADTAADVVVMGTHGREGFSHLLLGSVAEKIVRHATVPVVTTRLPGPEVAHTAEERALEDELAG